MGYLNIVRVGLRKRKDGREYKRIEADFDLLNILIKFVLYYLVN